MRSDDGAAIDNYAYFLRERTPSHVSIYSQHIILGERPRVRHLFLILHHHLSLFTYN
jgi:hypothetical protein